jgi:hypothetical protein
MKLSFLSIILIKLDGQINFSIVYYTISNLYPFKLFKCQRLLHRPRLLKSKLVLESSPISLIPNLPLDRILYDSRINFQC